MDEWLQSYENHVAFSRDETINCILPDEMPGEAPRVPEPSQLPASPSSRPVTTTPQSSWRVLKFEHHKTVRTNGHLILFFRDINTHQLVLAYCNASIEYQRGPKKRQQLKMGMGGQFFPKPWSKFREWWMQVVGHEPTRWANAYKELRSRLKGKLFEAEVVTAYSTSGSAKKDAPYLKATALPRLLQSSNKTATTMAQSSDNNPPQATSETHL